MLLRSGERIGDWIVERPLGEGGMGAVYRVHSALTRRLVAALKVMKPSAEPDSRARFVREAEALAALRHPAVVRVMEFAEDEDQGLLYLVMELAVGDTLRARFEGGPMSVPEAMATFLPLAQGLDHAHAAGVFHRDLKPSNVVLCHDGTVRLVDFGIAAAKNAEPLTNTGQLGTLAYLPPEVFRGEKADPAKVDVYALGQLICEGLTGQRSFPVDPALTPAAAAASVGVRKLQTAALELPETYPSRLRDLVRRATDPDPAARPAMRELRAQMESLVERRGSAEPTPQRRVALPAVQPAPYTDPAERTMRVPDPTDVRVARGSLGRRLLVAGGITALVLVGGLALLANRTEAERPSPAAAAEAPEAAGPGRQTERASPGAPAAASPSPSAAPAASPSATPTPAATPRPQRPSPSPSPLFWTYATPSPSAPPPTPRPTPVPQRSEPPAEDPGPAEEEDPAETDDLSGQWELTNEVEATNHPAFAGLRLGYRLTLVQDGERVFGRGRKFTENGAVLPPEQRTPITVDGRIEGDYLVLSFVERGALRTSSGTARWLIGPGRASLQGRFASDAAQSSGSSRARRIR